MSDIDAGTPAHPPDPPAGAREDALPKARLLIFEYDAGSVRLVESKRIEMLAPPDDSARTEQGRAGHWVEVRNAVGDALYRQVITRPFLVSAEVHSPEPGAMPRHVPVSTIEGRFQVVVPDLPDASEVVLFGLGMPGEQAQRATSLARGDAEAREAAPREASPLMSARLKED